MPLMMILVSHIYRWPARNQAPTRQEIYRVCRMLVNIRNLTNILSVKCNLIVSVRICNVAIVDISSVQSSAQTFIHNAILFIDTSNNAWHNQAHWVIGTPYLSTIASNVQCTLSSWRENKNNRKQYHWNYHFLVFFPYWHSKSSLLFRQICNCPFCCF